MKLPRFQIHRPTSIAEALELRGKLGDTAVFYAGGTELLLIMKLGLGDYSHLVDLKRIEGLAVLEATNDEMVVGAAVTHLELESNPIVREVLPALAAMSARIGNTRVRNSGTIGGNLAFADPHSDPATFLTAVGASVNLTALDGSTRRVLARDFTLAPYTTGLAQDELVTSVSIPIPDSGTRVSHQHLRFRERPAVVATVSIRQSNGMTVSAVAVGGVCGAPVRLATVESLIAERPAGLAGLIAESTAASVEPIEDLDGSAEYKRHLAGTVVARCVMDALGEAKSGGW